jgi:polysaccharide export outer membrane protein
MALSLFSLITASMCWGQDHSDVAALQPKPESTRPSSDEASKKSAPEKAKDGSNAAKAPPAGVRYDPLSYHIGIADELAISVWREQELSLDVTVRPDGMITLPLLDDLKVTGMTTKELQSALTEKLKEFVKEPQVTIIVRQIHSRKIFLVGQVAKPGMYPLNDSRTVLELLAEAGGPGPYAKLGSIYVIRHQESGPIRLPFNYKKAILGKNLSDDIVLLPGDMVVVP